MKSKNGCRDFVVKKPKAFHREMIKYARQKGFRRCHLVQPPGGHPMVVGEVLGQTVRIRTAGTPSNTGRAVSEFKRAIDRMTSPTTQEAST